MKWEVFVFSHRAHSEIDFARTTNSRALAKFTAPTALFADSWGVVDGGEDRLAGKL
jgi:hypothetical protein